MKTVVAVVDVELFKHKKEPAIVKEIAVSSSNSHIDSIILQPPCSWDTLSPSHQRSYEWLEQNLHGLDWNSGEYPYTFLNRFIDSVKLRLPDTTKFFAKGLEKCNLLSDLFDLPFENIEQFNSCPRINDSKFVCGHNDALHYTGDHCARQKAQHYQKWIEHILEATK